MSFGRERQCHRAELQPEAGEVALTCANPIPVALSPNIWLFKTNFLAYIGINPDNNVVGEPEVRDAEEPVGGRWSSMAYCESADSESAKGQLEQRSHHGISLLIPHFLPSSSHNAVTSKTNSMPVWKRCMQTHAYTHFRCTCASTSMCVHSVNRAMCAPEVTHSLLSPFSDKLKAFSKLLLYFKRFN